MSYTPSNYAAMIADQIRTDAYLEAMRQTIRPGCTVLEIGTGTGFFALEACRLGAGHVYAVEDNPSVQIARDLVRANNLGDRVTLMNSLSTRINLPQRADVLISDLRGWLPTHPGHVEAIVDARARHLVPRAAMLPRVDRLYAALVRAPEIHARLIQPWSRYGVMSDLSVWGSMLANQIYAPDIAPEQLVSPPQLLATWDYRELTSPTVDGSVELAALSPGEVHGVLVWFDAELTDNVAYSGLDGKRSDRVYGTMFVPWPAPVQVHAGDLVKIRIRANLIAGEYVWTWRSELPTAQFEQSTLFAEPLSMAQIRRVAAAATPGLSDAGRQTLCVLQRIEAGASVEEAAADLRAAWPDHYRDAANALQDAQRILRRCNP